MYHKAACIRSTGVLACLSDDFRQLQKELKGAEGIIQRLHSVLADACCGMDGILAEVQHDHLASAGRAYRHEARFSCAEGSLGPP